MFQIYLLLLLIFLSNSINDRKLDGIYNIINIKSGLNFKSTNNKIILTTNHKSYFRIINIKNNSYYIRTIFRNLDIGINNEDKIIIYRNRDEKNLKFQWNINKINRKKYYIPYFYI